MSASGWRIVFTDGTEENTPDDVDKLEVSDDGMRLFGISKRTYGPDRRTVTYVLANVRKWVQR